MGAHLRAHRAFLAFPAMTAAGGYEALSAVEAISNGVGSADTAIAIVVAFGVAYASIAWLLRFVARHKISVFIWYGLAVGLALAVALALGAVSATWSRCDQSFVGG